ncbi:MAG: rhodanese-like domain-containing protein [Oscillospiraceae bacterium]|jgi:phage shock protein E
MKRQIKKWMLVFASALSVLLSACAGGGLSAPDVSDPAYRTITAQEAKAILDGTDPFVLLDVRTETEFQQGHIEGAILIPNDALADRAAEELPDRDALILLYCRSGRRSAAAAKQLSIMGYTNVIDFGGIIDWPYETVSGEKK